jgi:hypothetical protein
MALLVSRARFADYSVGTAEQEETAILRLRAANQRLSYCFGKVYPRLTWGHYLSVMLVLRNDRPTGRQFAEQMDPKNGVGGFVLHQMTGDDGAN